MKYIYTINYGTSSHQTVSKLFYDKVHGIECTKLKGHQKNAWLIVVHGGREFATFYLYDNTLELIKITKITDWINSIRLYENTLSFSLVTSHNVVQRVTVDVETRQHEFAEKSWCTDSSTLYCSKIIGEDWKTTVVFAGTALGDILVWCPIDGVDSCQRAKILHRLSGHNGVIFSIDVDLERHLMTTTSDDRSVRLWHLDGAGSCPRTDAFRPGKQLYGHIARVFKSKIIAEGEMLYDIPFPDHK